MNHGLDNSQNDVRLRRAFAGGAASILPFMVAVIALEFAEPSGVVSSSLFCLSFCMILLIGNVVAWRYPFKPKNDHTQDELRKASMKGPWMYLGLGVGFVGIGVWTWRTFACMSSPYFVTVVATGSSLILWSTQFPKLPNPPNANRWQFSIRAILVTTLLVAMYMGAVVLLSQPGDGLVFRLAKPVLTLCGLCFMAQLVYIVVLPIRLAWFLLAKVFLRKKSDAGAARPA